MMRMRKEARYMLAGIIFILGVPSCDLTATLLASMPAFAWKFELGENTNLNINYLLQVHAHHAGGESEILYGDDDLYIMQRGGDTTHYSCKR